MRRFGGRLFRSSSRKAERYDGRLGLKSPSLSLPLLPISRSLLTRFSPFPWVPGPNIHRRESTPHETLGSRRHFKFQSTYRIYRESKD